MQHDAIYRQYKSVINVMIKARSRNLENTVLRGDWAIQGKAHWEDDSEQISESGEGMSQDVWRDEHSRQKEEWEQMLWSGRVLARFEKQWGEQRGWNWVTKGGRTWSWREGQDWVLLDLVDQCFSNLNVPRNHLGILLKCRSWFSMSRMGPEVSHF